MSFFKNNLIKNLLLIGLLSYSSSFGQQKDGNNNYTTDTSYDSIIRKINEFTERDYRLKYANLFLTKAKKENNQKYMIGGYEIFAALHKGLNAIPYLDTIINLTKAAPSNFNPSNAYKNKGNSYYHVLKYKVALENYLLAQRFAQDFPNEMLEAQIIHGISTIKNRIGDFKSSIELSKKNLNYYKKDINEYTIDYYLNSLFSTSVGYLSLKILDSVEPLNREGIKLSKQYKRNDKLCLFKLSLGIWYKEKQEFSKSLDTIRSTLISLEENGDMPNLSVAYYSIAENLNYLDKEDEAILYFNKIDSLYVNEEVLVIEVRDSYNYLQKYYERINDEKNQLKYLKKTIAIDSILKKDKILENEISLKFDIPKLISKRDGLIDKLEKNKSKLNTYIIILFSVLILLLSFFVNFRFLMKKRFKKLMSNMDRETPTIEDTVKKVNDSPIPEEIIKEILISLKKFEDSYEFIDPNLTLSSLSKKIHSNSTYVSKVINEYKGKNFSDYLKEQRVLFALNKLKHDPNFRKYTIQAISSEVGFKSAETFSKFFKSYTGIYPSYFVKQLIISEK